jgi:hypothetical protein
MSGIYLTWGERARYQEPQSRAEVTTTGHGFPTQAEFILIDRVRGERVERIKSYEGVDGSTIYISRKTGTPKAFGAPGPCDFESAVSLGDWLEHREDIQPDIYRAPEVILDINPTDHARPFLHRPYNSNNFPS